MTVSIAWWWFPIASIAVGFAAAVYFTTHPKGDFDMVSPLVGAGCLILGVCIAIAFAAGKLFS
jgi:hypothetical protein